MQILTSSLKLLLLCRCERQALRLGGRGLLLSSTGLSPTSTSQDSQDPSQQGSGEAAKNIAEGDFANYQGPLRGHFSVVQTL